MNEPLTIETLAFLLAMCAVVYGLVAFFARGDHPTPWAWWKPLSLEKSAVIRVRASDFIVVMYTEHEESGASCTTYQLRLTNRLFYDSGCETHGEYLDMLVAAATACLPAEVLQGIVYIEGESFTVDALEF